MRHLILFGFKGVGKSHWGKRLATTFRMPFIDTDQLIIALDGKNRSCREIHQTLSEEAFRKLESEAIASLTRVHIASVIAVGGGAILVAENRALLQKMGILFYLKGSHATIKKRILTPPFPSFLDQDNPEFSFEEHYFKRLSLYQNISAYTIDVDQKRVIQQIKECLGDGK